MREYIYCPGNGARYHIAYGQTTRNMVALIGVEDKVKKQNMIAWLKRGGSGGVCMMFDSYLHITYLCEKMDIRHGDGEAILAFLREMGHDTSHGRCDTWRPGTLEVR